MTLFSVQGGYMAFQGGYVAVQGGYMLRVGSRDAYASKNPLEHIVVVVKA